MLDYKDVCFSFQNRKRRLRRRWVGLLLLLAMAGAVAAGIGAWKAGLTVRKIESLLLAGRLDEADRRLRAAGVPLMRKGDFLELQALEELFRGRIDAAAARFDSLRRAGASTSLRTGRFLAHFFERGEIQKLKVYTDHLLPRGGDELFWYDALCRASRLDADGAEKAAARLSPSFRKENAKALGILNRFDRSLRAGRIDYILDRNEVPLAYYDLSRRTTRPLVPGIDFSALDARFRSGASFFHLSLDNGLQKKIDRLFQNHFGTLVLLDLPENGIAAAYSKPRSPGKGNAAFSNRFSPGSIVKIVTLLAHLRRDDHKLFPISCSGSIEMEDRRVHDLTPHGRVRDASHALALSCNVAFARMGKAAGSASMTDLLRRFSFNAPAFGDSVCEFATGRFVDDAFTGPKLAESAAGLGGVSTTTVHAALLASIVSQNGRFFPPYLVDNIRNILDLEFHRHEPHPKRTLTDDLNFLRVKRAMAAVVEDPDGTGRRARGGIRLAVKTGTTGSSAGGLDAVIVGFAPLEKPRYAFAFRLEGGGRADVDGALFLKDLAHLLFPEAA